MINELKKTYNLNTDEILANLIMDYPGHSAFWLSCVSGYSESTCRQVMYKFMVWGIVTIKDKGQGCYHDYRWSHIETVNPQPNHNGNKRDFITYKQDERYSGYYKRGI